MNQQQFRDQYPESAQWIEAKAAGLPGSHDNFKKYRETLPDEPYEGSPRASFDYAWEARITDDFDLSDF